MGLVHNDILHFMYSLWIYRYIKGDAKASNFLRERTPSNPFCFRQSSPSPLFGRTLGHTQSFSLSVKYGTARRSQTAFQIPRPTTRGCSKPEFQKLFTGAAYGTFALASQHIHVHFISDHLNSNAIRSCDCSKNNRKFYSNKLWQLNSTFIHLFDEK